MSYKSRSYNHSKKLGSLGKAYTKFRVIRLDPVPSPAPSHARSSTRYTNGSDSDPRIKFPSVYLREDSVLKPVGQQVSRVDQERGRISKQILQTQLQLQQILNITSEGQQQVKIVRRYHPVKPKKIQVQSLASYYNDLWNKEPGLQISAEQLRQLEKNRKTLLDNRVFQHILSAIRENKARVPRYLQIVQSRPRPKP